MLSKRQRRLKTEFSLNMSSPPFLQFTSDQSKGLLVTMNTATPTEFEFSFLEEGFSARDIVEQKINESSMSVSVLC